MPTAGRAKRDMAKRNRALVSPRSASAGILRAMTSAAPAPPDLPRLSLGETQASPGLNGGSLPGGTPCSAIASSIASVT